MPLSEVVLATSEDLLINMAFLEILATTFMQCIPSTDLVFN